MRSKLQVNFSPVAPQTWWVDRALEKNNNNLSITRNSVCIALGPDSPLHKGGLLQVSHQVGSTAGLSWAFRVDTFVPRSLVYSDRLLEALKHSSHPRAFARGAHLSDTISTLALSDISTLCCSALLPRGLLPEINSESNTQFCFLVSRFLVECADCV